MLPGSEESDADAESELEDSEPLDLDGTDVGFWEISNDGWHGIATFGGALVVQGAVSAYLVSTGSSLVLILLVFAFLFATFFQTLSPNQRIAYALLAGLASTAAETLYFIATAPGGKIDLATAPVPLGIVLGLAVAGGVLLAVALVGSMRTQAPDDD